MVQVMMPGLSELMLLVLMSGGMGVPLGIPPQDPDPVLVRIAPEQCLYYSAWVAMAKPDPASANQTEQLLAEPEMQEFLGELESLLDQLATKAGQRGDPRQQALAQHLPVLAKLLFTHAASLFVETVVPRPNGFDARGALVVNLGDDVPRAQAAWDALRQQIPAPIMQEVQIEGIACVRLQPTPDMPSLTIGWKDHYLVVAMGDGSFEGVLERAETPPPDWLTQAVADLPVPRPATLAYLNLEAITQLAVGLGGPRVQATLETLGLARLTRVVSMSGLDETGFVSRFRVVTQEPNRGLWALLADQPLQSQDLRGIPADASLAVAVRFDLAELLAKSVEIIREIEPNAAQQYDLGLATVNQILGLDVQQELLGALGDVWTVHAAPSGGGLLAGWTVAVDVRDMPRLKASHDQLLQRAQAQFARLPAERAPHIQIHETGTCTIYTLEVADADFYLAPSWCLTDSHLVVTLFPQALKSYLVQAQSNTSLADQPVVASLLGIEHGPCKLIYQDTRSHFLTFYPWLQVGAQAIARQLKREDLSVNVAALPSTAAVVPHLRPSVVAVRRTADGFEYLAQSTLPGASVGASAPVAVALLLPAVQAAREAARRAQSMNNLKQMALAMHNYHDVFQAFPAAFNADADGKPLLSWRVHILPYIEQQQLYEQFRLDEPWDSDHNRELIVRMPEVYRSPNSGAEPGKTVYLGNAAEDGVLGPPAEASRDTDNPIGLNIREISDGTSNTIMVVEANDAASVVWTKPDDYVPRAGNPLQGLTGLRPGGFLAVLCDGSAQFISSSLDRQMLEALFTRSGGEVVNLHE